MGYVPDGSFILPSLDAVLWRYMDICKFESLLAEGLFFARADKLGDPFEESIPMANGPEPPIVYRIGDKTKVSPPLIPLLRQDLVRFTLISCWHMSDAESEVMWRRYCSENEGIAIRTDVEALRDCFLCSDDIWIGEVQYKDYKTEQIDANVMYLPFVTKRLSFAEEQEVRAVIDVKPEGENGHFRLKEDICEVGMPYAVDLKKLIKEVVVGPLARDNFVQNVQSLVDEHGLAVDVRRSDVSAVLTWGDPRDFPDHLTQFDDPGVVFVDSDTRQVYSRDGTLSDEGRGSP